MKLFYSPGACSLSPHIVSREAGIELALVKVEPTKQTSDGRNFLELNPKGYVPALELDSGEILTEGPVIAQYLADQRPEAGLVPAAGTIERYRLQATLGYINSEIHKSYSPLFNPKVTPETREDRGNYLRKRYALLDKQLEGKPYLFGDQFGVADSYLFTVTNWSRPLNVDLSEFKNIAAFQERVAARPAVKAAMVAEGLIKA